MKEWAIEHGATHLHALVPAPFRRHALRSMTPSSTPQPDGTAIMTFSWQGAHPGRARCLELPALAACAPPSRRAATPRGIPPATPSSRTKCSASPPHSAPYTGEALDKKTPLLRSMGADRTSRLKRVLAVLRRTPAPRGHHGRRRAGILPHPEGRIRAPRRPSAYWAHAVRSFSLQRPRARRTLLRLHPPDREQLPEGSRR